MTKVLAMDHALLCERLSALVAVESPSGHSEGLERCYTLMQSWGEPLLGRGARERRRNLGPT